MLDYCSRVEITSIFATFAFVRSFLFTPHRHPEEAGASHTLTALLYQPVAQVCRISAVPRTAHDRVPV